MKSKFELGKIYKTRKGEYAKLIHIFGRERDSEFKLLWVVGGIHFTTTLSGHFWMNEEGSNNDVLPPKLTGTVWVNIEPSWSPGRLYESRELADEYAGSKRTACIEVQWEEGQGLEDEN